MSTVHVLLVAAALPGRIGREFTVIFLLGGRRYLFPGRSIAVEDVSSVATAVRFSRNYSLGVMVRSLIDLIVSWQLRHGGSTGNTCTVCSWNGEGWVFAVVIVIFQSVYLLS